LRYDWTYEDVMKANAILDMQQAIKLAGDFLDEQDIKNKGNGR